MDKKDLDKLKEKLPKGWSGKIAKEIGKSPDWVIKVMNNLRNDPKVIDLAIELAEQKKLADDRRKKQINAL
jgi:hypothetical protein